VATLSAAQIAEHAHEAGFRGQDLTIAVAVALAESGGDTRAHNSVPPDDSYGLWQVNMHGGLGPDRRDEFNLDSDRELFDPKENAQAAWEISGRGDTFEPWSTYKNGAYRQFLDDARRGIKNMDKKDDKKKDDKKPTTGGKGGGKGGGGKNGGGGDGFMVDPDALSGYVRTARHMADDLGTLSSQQLKGVRNLADDSFGKIGKETGFAEALDHFGAALQRQVKGVGTKADTLAGSVSRTARHYNEQEQDIAQDLLGLLRGRE
jgi:hypothetical protein